MNRTLRLTLADGAPVRLSIHAAERYQERVRPALTVDQATAELEALLPTCATVSTDAPPWIPEDARTSAYVLLGDDIAFPIENRHATTCLIRGLLSPAERARRIDERRRRRRARRAKQRGRREITTDRQSDR